MNISSLRKIQWQAFLFGGMGVGLSLLGLILNPPKFFQSYLFNFLFWSELSLGSLGILMVSVLTGGEWGKSHQLALRAAVSTIFLLALLFIPLHLGVHHIYSWSSLSDRPPDLKFNTQNKYLNLTFFSARALFYFLGWMLLSFFLDRWIGISKNKSDLKLDTRLQCLCAGGLIFLGFSLSFAAIDWQMSLEPQWYSTIYGMVFVFGQVLGAWAFILCIPNQSIGSKTRIDSGNILLTLIMLWAYLSFMQYLIIWSGNLPEEVTWIARRTQKGWEWIAITLIFFQFVAPFFILLFRKLKVHPFGLPIVCSLILVVRVIDRYWMTMPVFQTQGIQPAWTDLTLFIGIGGIWIGVFLMKLRRRYAHVLAIGQGL